MHEEWDRDGWSTLAQLKPGYAAKRETYSGGGLEGDSKVGDPGMARRLRPRTRLACDARAAGHRSVRRRRDRAVRLVNRPHELLGDQLPDVRAVRLHVAVRGREVARLAYAVVDILQAPVLQSCVLFKKL